MSKIITTEYKNWLTEIKQNFQSSQIKASVQVNSGTSCSTNETTIVTQLIQEVFFIPLGISEYQLTEVLPKEFQSSLPSIKQIEGELKENSYE